MKNQMVKRMLAGSMAIVVGAGCIGAYEYNQSHGQPGATVYAEEDVERLKEAAEDVLDQGGVVICSMKPGDFTAAGHFVVIYGYDSEGFLVNDPNCVARSRESWSYDVIGKQIKQMWTYQKGNSGQSYIAENSTGLKR